MSINAEEFRELVAARRSLRAFQAKPLDQVTLDSVFEAALRAPSNCNTQPWLVHVASGEKIEQLRQVLPQKFMAGEISMDFPYDGVYEGVYKERQYGAAQALYDALGIAREEKDKRQATFMRNFIFFDAPHVAFMFLPAPFGLREAADLGMYAQTLMLSMTAHGLGSCPQTALSFEADPIREVLGVDASQKLLFGISFGYPVADAPVNTCLTDRGSLADIVTFHQ